MKTLHQTNCEIFEIVKNKELILYSELPKMLGVDQDLVLQSIGKLKNDHGLISVKSQKLSLTEKGLKQKTFESYLESLKKEPIPRYQKIYLPLFILFGFSAMILGILNYNSNRKNDVLKSQVNSLTNKSRIYKDSVGLLKSKIELYKKQSIIDTSQTKNSTYSNTDKDLKTE